MTDTAAFAGSAGFGLSELTTAEVEELESYLVPLADSVRALVDATIRTTVSRDEVLAATAAVDAVTARLRASQIDGAAGVHFNTEGRAWQWGNAAVGTRNAAAPQLEFVHGDDGVVRADVVLGAAHEGPPGRVHGGLIALLVDHLLGVTASSRQRPAMTGTLTLRYVRATPLGPVRLAGWIEKFEGWKTLVRGTVSDADGVTVEIEGVFVMPRWAREMFPMPGTVAEPTAEPTAEAAAEPTAEPTAEEPS